MENNKLILPLILPLFTAIFMVFSWNRVIIQKIINLISLTVLLGISINLFHTSLINPPLALTMGSWPPPFGITFVLDILSAAMIFITALIAWCAGLFCLKDLTPFHFSSGILPFFQFLLMGVNGSFLTGDLFNLYVWYEVMLMSSFILLTIGGQTEQLGAGLKYVIINLVSSLFFLSAMGVLFGLTGTLNMADLAQKFSTGEINLYVKGTFLLLFIAFAIKSAVFPLFFWLPLSYPVAPATISAIFAGLLTKVGVYSLIRVSTLMFSSDFYWLQEILFFVAGTTMLTGVLGAVSKNSMRKILSFHIISQIGYMIFGLAFFSLKGLSGAIFYIVHHIAVKSNLFLLSGAVEKVRNNDRLGVMGDIYKNHPFLSILFLIPALSLAGLPPLSGFFAKFSLLVTGFEEDALITTGISLLVGLLTLYSMMKIWSEGFWKKASTKIHLSHRNNIKIPYTMIIPIIVLSIFTLLMGFGAGPAMRVSDQAAAQLLNPNIYIKSVLVPKPLEIP
jgi:multicomponent Na+:H+ antiporter subunit D